MATVRDLARLLGLSASTVSRALRQDPRLRDTTIQLVMQAAAEHGFPNVRPLPTGTTARLILVLLRHSIESGIPQHNEAIAGIRRQARRLGVALTIHHHQDMQVADLQQDAVLQRVIADPRLAGIIVMGGCPHDVAACLHQRAPLVSMGHDVPIRSVDAVQADHQRSAETLVDHLFQLGHHQIGYVSAAGDEASTRDRLSGYRSAMYRLGLDADPAWVVRPLQGPAGAAEFARLHQFIQRGVRAWVVGGNNGGADCIQALERYQWRIPQQVSVVSFHHMGVLSDGRRPTACPIPFQRLGQELVGSLQDRWQGRGGGRRLLITCPLIPGDTSAPY